MVFTNGSILFPQARVITGTVAYMKNQFLRNTDCYSAVITAYALTFVQPDSEDAQFVTEKLRGCSSFDGGTGNHS